MESTQLKSLLESLIFVSETPLKVGEMLQTIQDFETSKNRADAQAEGESEDNYEQVPTENPSSDVEAQLEAKSQQEESKISRSELQQALEELTSEYQLNPTHGIVLAEVAGGWQFRTRPENGALLRQLCQVKPTRLSKPSLETLAIVAYRQPVTRVEIDEIRGVDTGGVLKTLLEKNLLRIVGKKEEPGRPMLYGTTQEFLELFQLKSLKDLPTLKEFRELEEEFQNKATAEGTVVENIPEDTQDFITHLEETAHAGLEFLDEEEEAVIEELEGSLKDLRQREKDIFVEEGKEAASATNPPPPENAETPRNS